MLGKVGNILLVVCAAGGFQRLCQETGMAEMFGERLIGWHIEAAGGVLLPFLIAAAIKTLQGSSLVAAITAAGMMQPMLDPLGLAGTNGKALAALAIGAGAMTISHVNDDFFWLVSGSRRTKTIARADDAQPRHPAAGPDRRRGTADFIFAARVEPKQPQYRPDIARDKPLRRNSAALLFHPTRHYDRGSRPGLQCPHVKPRRRRVPQNPSRRVAS